MRIVDPLGQRTELSFSGWKTQPELREEHVPFAPPKGVDVVAGG